MQQVILITGASSGFGALAARAFAHAGHIVYASMRDTAGRNAPQVQSTLEYAVQHNVDLRTVELDVQSQDSADAAIAQIIAGTGGWMWWYITRDIWSTGQLKRSCRNNSHNSMTSTFWALSE